MTNKKILNEYEAAVASGMSPELLKWLTKNPPKHADTRVLKVEKIENNRYFHEEEELLSFNSWLKSPWPHKDGKRPHVPAGIQREIKIEANGECAICRSNKDSCEAAHLEPVAKTFNNHPENLLWLCSNHHTSFDKGLFFGPKPEDADFVRDFKQALYYFKRNLWLMQQELRHKLFAMLQTCDVLAKQLEAPKTKDSTISKALGQVSALRSINGKPPTTRCASFFMLKAAGAEGRVLDPPGDSDGIGVVFDERDALAKAYSFFLDRPTVSLFDQIGEGYVGREVENGVFFAKGCRKCFRPLARADARCQGDRLSRPFSEHGLGNQRSAASE